jgi:hypothetical protein
MKSRFEILLPGADTWQAGDWCWRDDWNLPGQSAFMLFARFQQLNALSCTALAELLRKPDRWPVKHGIDLRDMRQFDLLRMSDLMCIPLCDVAAAFLPVGDVARIAGPRQLMWCMLTIAVSASEVCPARWRYALPMTYCLTPSRVISRFDDISYAMSCKGIAGVSVPQAAISHGGSMHVQRHRSVRLLKRYCDGGQNGRASAYRRIFSADANMGCLVFLSGFRSSHQLACPDGPRR